MGAVVSCIIQLSYSYSAQLVNVLLEMDSGTHHRPYANLTLKLTITYLLTPWCRVLLEKLTGLQLVKKFPVFHGTQRFITALTSVRHLSLSWASPIQSTYPHLTSWRSILILSTHLRLGLPSGLFTSGFPTKTLYTPLSSPIRATFETDNTKKISVHFTPTRTGRESHEPCVCA